MEPVNTFRHYCISYHQYQEYDTYKEIAKTSVPLKKKKSKYYLYTYICSVSMRLKALLSRWYQKMRIYI